LDGDIQHIDLACWRSPVIGAVLAFYGFLALLDYFHVAVIG
jgi:hypothetical protein